MRVIAFEAVVKRYGAGFARGTVALDGMTFMVERGECFAVVGPNGAGKSTILGLILGYLKPNAGIVRVCGEEPWEYVRARGIGYLPEVVELPGHLRVPAALRRLAVLDGLREPELESRVQAAIARVELEDHARKRIRALSKGNRQRLGIAQLLLEPRELILMDEPASGLDPLWRARFRDLVTELRVGDGGRTIVISSHDLAEIERVADRVAIIDRGRLREIVDLRRAAAPRAFLLRTSGAVDLGEYLPSAQRVDGGWRVALPDAPAVSRALRPFLAAGGVLEALVPETHSLEHAVREALGRTPAAGHDPGGGMDPDGAGNVAGVGPRPEEPER